MFHIKIWGDKPTKAPPRGDRTGEISNLKINRYYTTSDSLALGDTSKQANDALC